MIPIHFDEATWEQLGDLRRKPLAPYVALQSRRVTALAAYRPFGRRPRLDVFTAERT